MQRLPSPSYTWGAANPVHTISIGDKVLAVRKNLFDFLEHVSRKQNEDWMNWGGWWWVDALCIQQRDGHPEKALQIEGMRQTFADARQTVAWLGAGHADSQRGLELLLDFLESPRFKWGDVQKLVSANPGMIAAAMRAFGDRYWTRVCILQELVVSGADGR